MKENLRKVLWLFRHGLDAERFFAVTVYDCKVVMMCKYDPKLSVRLSSKKWVSKIDGNGFVCFGKSNIEIAMT